MKKLLLAVSLLLMMPAVRASDWQTRVMEALPLLGHRNWIVIADSAYPWQVSPGIETVNTGADQLEVARFVMQALSKSNHVQPRILLDREMDFLSEDAAPGISAYRTELVKVLNATQAEKLPHDKIIARLDEAGKTFHILLLKTTGRLPYTSVFLPLECGYWNADKEKSLRKSMASGRD